MFYKNPSVVFTETPAYKKIKSFVESINSTILNTVTASDQHSTSHHTDITAFDSTLERHDDKIAMSPKSDYSNFVRDGLILPVLKDIRSIVEDTPIGSPGRYANLGMVNVLDKIKTKFGESKELHNQSNSTQQISDNNLPRYSTPTEDRLPNFNYLTESFGNRIRMDYGTGHELNFICYLYTKIHDTAETIDELNISDSQLLFLLVNIDEYLEIIRKFIQKFNIEPAGARGCWAVSDYSLIGHLLGSAIDYIKETILTSHIHSFGKQNYSLASLIVDAFGNMLKETVRPNPNVMLIKILKLPRVLQNKGFKTMYDKEVFRRNVVTQHFIYSEYLSD